MLSQRSVSEPFKASLKTVSYKINNSVEKVAQLTVVLLPFQEVLFEFFTRALKFKFAFSLHCSLLLLCSLGFVKQQKLATCSMICNLCETKFLYQFCFENFVKASENCLQFFFCQCWFLYKMNQTSFLHSQLFSANHSNAYRLILACCHDLFS